MAIPDTSSSAPAGAVRDDLVGRVMAGRYRLVASIGVGASSRVYLADDVRLRRRVAVKVLHPALAGDPTFLRRFQAEAQAAAAINHPNVVAVYDWGRDEGAPGEQAGDADAMPFLVTEYLEGGSLRSMLDGERAGAGDGPRTLTLSQTLLVALQVCRGLHHAHSRGLVHRDIKPANLLFGEDDRLRIADFGLARALAEASWTEPSGVVLGTARYVSPEQAEGRPCDTRSDLYSLALVMVECVTGVVPNVGETAVATLGARVGRAVQADAEVFGPLAPLIEWAGRADPSQRCTAAELATALMEAAQDLTAPEPLPFVPRVVSRRPSPPALAGATEHTDRTPLEAVLASVAAGGGLDVLAGTDITLDAASAVPVAGGAAAPVASAVTDERQASTPGGARSRRRRGRRGSRRARARTWFVLLVVLGAVVVAGLLGRRLLGGFDRGPATFPVFDYVGRDAAVVEDEIAAAGHGWVVSVQDERRDGVPTGAVVAQDPPAGSNLVAGGELRLVRSIGELLVEVPSLVGMSIDDPVVATAFSSVSLLIDRVERHDEEVPPGTILSVAGAGRNVEKYSRVRVVVSSGPAPRVLADFATGGRAADEVIAALGAAGLVVDEVREASETVAVGKVVRTDPGAGAEVAKGSTVIVVVSSGPPLLTVPEVYGMNGRDAEDYLISAGWRVTGIDGPSSGVVIGTDPEAGQQRVKGSPIRIITRSN